MNADIDWVLENLVRASRLVEHRGKFLSKAELKAVMLHGKQKGYKTIAQFKDKEVDHVLAHRFDNVITPAEAKAVMDAHPEYKWRYRGGKLLMNYGTGKHLDRIRKVDGKVEHKRHVHDSPAYSDMMGHQNFMKQYIRFDVLVYNSVNDMLEGRDPINY
jgi:hypothetical protein